MTAFSDAFRSEVLRMARKEIKAELGHLRKTVTAQRSEIAALKRDFKALTTQLRALAKSEGKAKTSATRPHHAQGPSESAGSTDGQARGGRKFTFNHEALIAKRHALHLTQKEMARLLGVSIVSVYKWETGEVMPRAVQLERVREVLKMGVRAARKEIAE
jgi:DNA-binding transcriptional regulator YiaG